jgi:hypothetical protein
VDTREFRNDHLRPFTTNWTFHLTAGAPVTSACPLGGSDWLAVWKFRATALGQIKKVDVELSVDGVTETVQVTAEPPLLTCGRVTFNQHPRQAGRKGIPSRVARVTRRTSTSFTHGRRGSTS